MASEAEMASNALQLLGAAPINDLSDDSDSARLASRFLPVARDETLRDHPWKSATFRRQLAENVSGPAFGIYTRAYTLPTDPYCLRVLATNLDPDEGGSGEAWEVEGRTIVTSAAPLFVRFIGRVLDPNLYDALLKAAIEQRLASMLAYPMLKSLTVVRDLLALYDRTLAQARFVNATEASARRRARTSWLTEMR